MVGNMLILVTDFTFLHVHGNQLFMPSRTFYIYVHCKLSCDYENVMLGNIVRILLSFYQKKKEKRKHK